jgi:predicted heme/steroid binding protein
MAPLDDKRKLSPFHILFGLIVFLCFSSITYVAWATTEFSCQTGESCIFCHENPDGDDILTAAGEKFLEADYSFDKEQKPYFWKRILRLIVGFLHILFSVIWFGAIFYIHLFVKPASLTSGLPRNERILGWICILVVGLTGILLTIFRVRSPDELWTTTFGIIWMIKAGIFLIMVLIAAIATTRINRLMKEAYKKEKVKEDAKETIQTQFIYNGVLYDVGDSKLWKNGVHMGRHYVGTDLTSSMPGAPHGVEVLERIKKIGPASDIEKEEQIPAVRHFIFMAYFILFCMLGILFCVAYWNWGPSLVS